MPLAGHHLLGVGKRTGGDRTFPPAELEPLGRPARVEAAVADHHPRLDELLVERLELGHHLGRRGGRDVVLLGQNQYTHLLSPSIRLDTEVCNLSDASNGKWRFRHAGLHQHDPAKLRIVRTKWPHLSRKPRTVRTIRGGTQHDCPPSVGYSDNSPSGPSGHLPINGEEPGSSSSQPA